MSDLLCEINISDIDLTNEQYKISLSRANIPFLARSIKEAGLICPPIVKPLNNKYIIVCGFNRIKALLQNDRIKIPVYKTKPGITDYQCLLTSITRLAFKRPLTHAELVISTKRLSRFVDKEEIAEKSSAIFNTELNTRFITDLLAIGALPDPALELLHCGNLSFKSARRIAFFEKETIHIFLNIFSQIKASNNKQLEIIQNIMEIAARDGIKPRDLFNNQEIQKILFDKNKEPGLKTRDLRAYLFKQRFPTIFKTNQMVREKIASIKLGNKIKFIPPENFEDQNYSISFTAKNYNEFKANTHLLTAALENKAIEEIFSQ